MPRIQFVINGETESGQIQVTGPIDDMRIVHWALGEALRICEFRADEKLRRELNSAIVVAPANSLPGKLS